MNLNENELIKITSDLVKIPSINPTGQEKEVTNYLTALLIKEEIPFKLIPVDENRKNIVAILSGKTNSDALIFTGHQDVVPISEEELKRWNKSPFSGEVDEKYIYGRGSSDMKGGLASALYAMITLKRNKITPKHTIILVATVDEEHYMKGVKECIKDSDVKLGKYVIVCEPTNLEICNASKGRTWGKITIHGKTAHGSQKGLGINAIEKASDLIQHIKNHAFTFTKNEHGETFWQAYAISGGVEPAIVPDSCTIYLDARLNLNHYPDELWQSYDEIINFISSQDKDFKSDLTIIEKRSPWITDKNEIIVKLLDKYLNKHDISPKYNVFQGTTDGTWFNYIGIKPVIFGPGDLSCVHMENERLEISQLITSCKVYIDLMLSY